MKEITQDKFYQDPTPESRGNCQQAATASILGLELHEVPNFYDCRDGFWYGFHQFVKSRGFRVVELPANFAPNVLYLAYGPSPRGVRHACVYRGGKLAWDPHPSRAGLIEVQEVNLIVPDDPSAFEFRA